ncbi:hypothetical protein DX912_10185 [Lysobacter soli]|uniref:Uncharacterized protein n=1 Tax=Lysobacter soli TaxID=453783 RepID=A0A3D8VCA2_9GAMM|nr:hypothetical protein [Lysobacter soli]RDY67042.1 hypothetical protein DX912_10185 [Lysobacter soli]
MTCKLNDFIGKLKKQLAQPDVITLENGAVLIGHLPHIGAKAYLHVVFPGQLNALSAMRKETTVAVPSEVEDFYREFNGMILFQGALSIYGARSSVSRDPDQRQPFDLADRNILRRPRFAAETDFFLGSYNEDGSLLFTERGSSRVFRRPAASRTILNTWSGVGHMLNDETDRIGRLFDNAGCQIDPSVPTSPQ